MIRALYGWSVVVVIVASWWPITRFAWREMRREHADTAAARGWFNADETGDNIMLTLRGIGAAFLGLIGAGVLGLFWPFIGLAWGIGYVVSTKLRDPEKDHSGKAERIR